ncbi:MAG: anti-sigma factor [Bryobacteraceae bacterium]
MTCVQLEILLCDYLDGTLASTERAELAAHLESCSGCAKLVGDAGAALHFMERVADVDAPPELLTRILNETASGRHGQLAVAGGLRGWIKDLMAPVLQPRLVMGMALTILSFSMMAKCAGVSPRQLRASDLAPARVWASLDDNVHRAYERSLKFYESIRFVYELQSRLREWTDQQEEEDRASAAGRPVEERRLPTAVTQPAGSTPAVGPREGK